MSIYKITNVGAAKCLNINGSNVTALTNHQNVTIYSDSGSNEQRWEISTIGTGQFVKSVINTTFGLNVYRSGSPYNCDVFPISGNETDAKVNFVSTTGGYLIKLTNYDLYLTVGSSSNGANVYWAAKNNSNYQIWTLTIPDPYTSKILSMPSGPRCNWNQKHSGVTSLFGGSACTLVAGLDAANFYATDGVGYTPSSMSGSTYWISGTGYTWRIPGPGKIGSAVTFTSQADARVYIKTQIDKGCPVLVSIGPSATQNHTVFAYGYKNNAATHSDIYVFDPANAVTSSIEGRVTDLANAMNYSNKQDIRNVRPTYRS